MRVEHFQKGLLIRKLEGSQPMDPGAVHDAVQCDVAGAKLLGHLDKRGFIGRIGDANQMAIAHELRRRLIKPGRIPVDSDDPRAFISQPKRRGPADA
jgi:hypothetical protein